MHQQQTVQHQPGLSPKRAETHVGRCRRQWCSINLASAQYKLVCMQMNVDANVARQSELLVVINKNTAAYRQAFGFREWRQACEVCNADSLQCTLFPPEQVTTARARLPLASLCNGVDSGHEKIPNSVKTDLLTKFDDEMHGCFLQCMHHPIHWLILSKRKRPMIATSCYTIAQINAAVNNLL